MMKNKLITELVTSSGQTVTVITSVDQENWGNVIELPENYRSSRNNWKHSDIDMIFKMCADLVEQGLRVLKENDEEITLDPLNYR